MIKTDFVPIDYDSFDFQGKNYVRIIGRNSEKKRICVLDSCEIYFWAILKDKTEKKKIEKLVNKIEKIKLDVKGRQTKVEKVELKNKNFLGKKVKALKIFATNYKDLHDIADKLDFPEIECRRGYDLGFITHYILEKEINPLQIYEISGNYPRKEFSGIESLNVDLCLELKSAKKIENNKFSPKVVAYDIETEDVQIGGGEILMISLISDKFKKVITWKKTSSSKNKESYVEYVEDEGELIERFVYYVKEISPDFLVGYFSDGFDLPYIKARAEKLKINLNLGLDNSQPRFFRSRAASRFTGKIFGIVHIDILRFIQTAYSQYLQSETLSLNEVAKELLGDTKKNFCVISSPEDSENYWQNYYEYNLQDSILTYNLFEKIWPDISEFTKIMQEPVFDVTRAGLSKYTESYILHNLEKFDEIPEKRPLPEQIGKRREMRVEGAFVLEPTPGFYENIAIFDFTSMHTSIIITHNLSKSTFMEKPEEEVYESPEINENGKNIKYYFSKKPGFFPELMKEIFELRKKAKEDYKKNPNPVTLARSNAFKVLSASAHGYVAFFGARYYSHEASATILSFVRKYNKETIEKVQKAGYKVIFSDTDSVAFLIGKRTKEDVKKLLKKLNAELPGVMHLELEGFYKKGLWVTKRTGTIGAKKKYALIDEEKKIKIRGFETVRRDWCPLAREIQNKIIKLILENGNEKKALEYIKEIIKELKEGKIEKNRLFIRTLLKKPISEYKSLSPHVIAAKKMRENGIPISGGNLIEYYISEPKNGKKEKLVRERVKLPDEFGKYDIKYYLEHQILPAVENIFRIFNININEIIEGKKQTKLGDF